MVSMLTEARRKAQKMAFMFDEMLWRLNGLVKLRDAGDDTGRKGALISLHDPNVLQIIETRM